MERLLAHLVCLILRYQLIGRGRTGRLEIESAAIAKGIYSKRLKTAHAVWKEARPLLADDPEFLEDFARYDEPRPARARWILRELEMQAWREANPESPEEKAPISDPAKINLEHVLPQNPGPEWKEQTRADPGLVDECATRLGNLCLLDRVTNKQEAAASFAQKRKAYAKSALLLTQRIAEGHQAWDRSAIDGRQQELAQLAARAWPIAAH